MRSFFNDSLEFLKREVDMEFLETASIMLAWEYDQLFHNTFGGKLPNTRAKELFGSGRAACAEKSLIHAAEKHKIPYSF